jgi:steroid 5-alpha reductase family enzyme
MLALAVVSLISGMVMSYVADTQLAAFMAENRERRLAGQPPVLILDTGLWYYSRHPNYCGENMFWWGLSLFAVRLGQPWMVCGTAFNTLCMVSASTSHWADSSRLCSEILLSTGPLDGACSNSF